MADLSGYASGHISQSQPRQWFALCRPLSPRQRSRHGARATCPNSAHSSERTIVFPPDTVVLDCPPRPEPPNMRVPRGLRLSPILRHPPGELWGFIRSCIPEL